MGQEIDHESFAVLERKVDGLLRAKDNSGALVRELADKIAEQAKTIHERDVEIGRLRAICVELNERGERGKTQRGRTRKQPPTRK